MSKVFRQIDPNQLDLDFTQDVDDYVAAKGTLLDAVHDSVQKKKPQLLGQNEMEDSIEIAAAVKRTVRECGITREQLVDGINDYFGRTEEGAKADPPTCRSPLTIHKLNNYLSKPCEYPLPAYMLYAIHSVTGIIEPGATILAAMGAQVVTAEESHLLNLGKIDQTLDELRQLRNQVKRQRR